MNAAEFARRRGRIEHDTRRSYAWRIKALARLVTEARALVVYVDGRHTSWRLPNGETVCIKKRFRSESAATTQLEQIARAGTDLRPKHPVRAYVCRYCMGWHLTSQHAHTYDEQPSVNQREPEL